MYVNKISRITYAIKVTNTYFAFSDVVTRSREIIFKYQLDNIENITFIFFIKEDPIERFQQGKQCDEHIINYDIFLIMS